MSGDQIQENINPKQTFLTINNTWVPLGLAVTIFLAVVGGVIAGTTLFNDVSRLKETVVTIASTATKLQAEVAVLREVTNEVGDLKAQVVASTEVGQRDSERITRLEVQFSQIASSLTKIETKIDQLQIQ